MAFIYALIAPIERVLLWHDAGMRYTPAMVTIPPHPRWLSLVTLLYGILLFLWLTPENGVWLAAGLGLGLSVLVAAHGAFRLAGRTFSAPHWLAGAVLLGVMVGGGGVIGTVLLMFLKSSLHNHVYPDYPLPMLLAMLERMPAWALAGALVGLAAGLLCYDFNAAHARRASPDKEPQSEG